MGVGIVLVLIFVGIPMLILWPGVKEESRRENAARQAYERSKVRDAVNAELRRRGVDPEPGS